MEFSLRTGRKMPAIAFGTGTTYFNRNEAVTSGILKAFEAGYRHFDTAIMYGTEVGVGNAVNILVKEKKAKREDIFVTTKVNSDQFTYQKVMDAMEKSFARLALDYIDLVMIHSPGIPDGYQFVDQSLAATFPKKPEDLKESRIAMWEALQDLKSSGKIRDIGVSNFNRFHLEQLIENPRCKEVPVINQIEFNPLCVDQEILEVCKNHGILLQAYAPLGSGPYKKQDDPAKSVLGNERLRKIALEVGVTTAQLSLGWALTKGVAVVTKTENEARMRENLKAAEVKLSSEVMAQIDQLNINQRLFWNPYHIP